MFGMENSEYTKKLEEENALLNKKVMDYEDIIKKFDPSFFEIKGVVDENIEEEKWTKLIDEITEKFSMSGSVIEDYSKLYPILLYNHVLNNEINLDYGNLEIDHIIPQTAFDNSRIDNSRIIQNGLFNLVLIPEDINKKKSNKRLNSLSNNDRSIYSKFSNIKLNDFDKYSEANNYKELSEYRTKLFKDSFIEKRRKYLNTY
jgi:hypothetical protein